MIEVVVYSLLHRAVSTIDENVNTSTEGTRRGEKCFTAVTHVKVWGVLIPLLRFFKQRLRFFSRLIHDNSYKKPFTAIIENTINSSFLG